MTGEEQRPVIKNEGRRAFIKNSASVILGGIAVAAAGGISPAFAEGSGFRRLSEAISKKASTSVGILDRNCQYPGYKVNGETCMEGQGYICSPGKSVSCTLTFSCTDGSDPSYGCTVRNFTCSGMDDHSFSCTHDYNCTPSTHVCNASAFLCSTNVNENYNPPQE